MESVKTCCTQSLHELIDLYFEPANAQPYLWFKPAHSQICVYAIMSYWQINFSYTISGRFKSISLRICLYYIYGQIVKKISQHPSNALIYWVSWVGTQNLSQRFLLFGKILSILFWTDFMCSSLSNLIILQYLNF